MEMFKNGIENCVEQRFVVQIIDSCFVWVVEVVTLSTWARAQVLKMYHSPGTKLSWSLGGDVWSM